MPSPGCVAAAATPSARPTASALAYCRQARRLRGRLGGQPARLHQKLRELAPERVAISGRSGAGPDPVTRQSRPALNRSEAGDLAERVAAEMDGPVLRYSRRRALLAEARRRGIGDFEANLIIAAVQHERRRNSPPQSAPASDRPAVSRFPLAAAALVILTESLLAAGAWHVLFT